MADEQPVGGEQPGSDGEDDQSAAGDPDRGDYEEELARYETELAEYLQQRIKPGLNSSAIPLMARSIAKEITRQEPPAGGPEDADAEDEAGEAPVDFEAEMHEFQAELGDDWILRFSVQGDDEWLTAEKEDGSQRLVAPNAQLLVEAVQLLDDHGGGGRSG